MANNDDDDDLHDASWDDDEHRGDKIRLNRDLLLAARTMGDNQARYLVSLYYLEQEMRKRADNQLRTLEDKPFLAVNGIQTMSHAFLNLLGGVRELRAMGVSSFRLSPHTCDMVAVARTFRDVLDGKVDIGEGQAQLAALALDAPFCDGFYAGNAGQTWSRVAAQ